MHSSGEGEAVAIQWQWRLWKMTGYYYKNHSLAFSEPFPSSLPCDALLVLSDMENKSPMPI